MSYVGLPLSTETATDVSEFFAVSRAQLLSKLAGLRDRNDIVGDYHINIGRDGNTLVLALMLPKGIKLPVDVILNGVHAMTVLVEELFSIANSKCSVMDGEPSIIIEGRTNSISVEIKRKGVPVFPIIDSFDSLKGYSGFFLPKNRESNGKYQANIRFVGDHHIGGAPNPAILIDDFTVVSSRSGRFSSSESNIREVPRNSERPLSVWDRPDWDSISTVVRESRGERPRCHVCAELAHNAVDEYVNAKRSFRIPENTCTQIHE